MSNRSIWPIDKTLSSATTLGQSGPRSDDKGTLHSLKLQHYWRLTIRLFRVIITILIGRVLSLCRDSVGIFCSPSWQGQYKIQWKCLWFNGYHYRKWTRWLEVKSQTRLFAFHIALIPLRKGMNSTILPQL